MLLVPLTVFLASLLLKMNIHMKTVSGNFVLIQKSKQIPCDMIVLRDYYHKEGIDNIEIISAFFCTCFVF